MIIVEDKLKEIFDTLPIVVIDGVDFTPIFDFGDEHDKNDFLAREVKKYPLVWLESGFEEDKKPDHVSVSVNLILATVTDPALLNSERLALSFKTVLIPLFKNVEKALCRSNNTIIVNQDYKTTKHYNYGGGATESKPVDSWDALQFRVDLNVYDNVLKTINYHG